MNATRIVTVALVGAVLLVPAPTVLADGQFGPGPHWVDTVTSGVDLLQGTAVLAGLDIDLDGSPDINLVLLDLPGVVGGDPFGDVDIFRTNAIDDSFNFPGLRPIDGHSDVVDVEIVELSLTSGPFSLWAGQGPSPFGSGVTLSPSLGAVAERVGDPTLAESFFDVFFELSDGVNFLYNQGPLRVVAVPDLTTLPPKPVHYIHLEGTIELWTSPIPGQGTHIANLLAAEHIPGPASIALLALGGLFARRRRR